VKCLYDPSPTPARLSGIPASVVENSPGWNHLGLERQISHEICLLITAKSFFGEKYEDKQGFIPAMVLFI
jgi:hypothetical protein